MYDLPSYVWALVLVGVIGIPATTCAMLYRGAVAAGIGRRAAGAVTAAMAIGSGGWIVVSAVLAHARVYDQAPGAGVPWLVVVFAGGLLALLLAARIPIVARILAAPDSPARLALPHTFRVAGVAFLIVMVQGHLPAAFALPAGFGDIAIGLTASFVARRLAQGAGRSEAVRFNLLGILDLVVAAGMGFVLFGFVPVTPTTEPLRLLPLALVPTVPVPLALALHIVSLQRLRHTAQREQGRTRQLVPAAE